MQKLLIREFSFQAYTEFSRPIPEGQAELAALADKMLAAFPYVLRPEDVSVFSDTKLYGYRLVFKLFNGSADTTLTSKSAISNFRDGRTAQALSLVSKSVDAIYKIMVNRPIQFNQLTFAVHAQFDPPDAYKDYMAKFIDTERGYFSGGKIVQADARDFKGELRFSTEKSSAVENGLYVSVQFLTHEPFTSELSDKMGKRFAEIASFEGFDIAFPQ